MRRIGGRELFSVVCCACAWALAAFYFFVHEPWQEEREVLRISCAKEEQEILGIENFMNAHRDLEEFSRETAKHQELSLKAMPREMEQGAFLEFLQGLALGKGIELTGVVPGKSISEGDVLVLPLQVNLKCNYFQLLDFLKGLQEGERFLQIRNAKIHSDKGKLACQLELAIFTIL